MTKKHAAVTAPALDEQVWKKAMDDLRVKVGEDNFNNWLVQLRQEASTDDKVAVLSTATPFLVTWVTDHYAQKILDVLRAEVPGIQEVKITLRRPVGKKEVVSTRSFKPSTTARTNMLLAGRGARTPPQKPERVPISKIQQAVAERYDISTCHLKSRDFRQAKVVKARRIAMYIAKAEGYSLAEIGAAFDKFSNGAVHEAVQRIKNAIRQTWNVQHEIHALLNDLSAQRLPEK